MLKNRIDNLEEARNAEEEYWNAKIDAIKAANDATEDQIELETLLQKLALAKSKKVKVYRQGQGFVYETDQEAVSEAESELNEYYRKKAFFLLLWHQFLSLVLKQKLHGQLSAEYNISAACGATGETYELACTAY